MKLDQYDACEASNKGKQGLKCLVPKETGVNLQVDIQDMQASIGKLIFTNLVKDLPYKNLNDYDVCDSCIKVKQGLKYSVLKEIDEKLWHKSLGRVGFHWQVDLQKPCQRSPKHETKLV